MNLNLGYCTFAGVAEGFCPSFVRFLSFGDRGNNASTRRAHGQNVSCLVESVLFRPLPVLKFAIAAWHSDPACTKTRMNKFMLFLSPETESNLQLLCAHWHNTFFFFGHVLDCSTFPKPSTLNLQPQPSTLTINPQPSTLNPKPSTLNPKPSTLNPQHSTVNPRPSTWQPSALNLQLSRVSTLNTQPLTITLNPQHLSLNH